MTKIGFIYATESGALRRVIQSDNEGEFERATKFGQGESILIIERDAPLVLSDCYPILEGITGLSAEPARCVVVDDKSDVVAAILADPAIDVLPGRTLVKNEFAERGWKLVDGVLVDLRVAPTVEPTQAR